MPTVVQQLAPGQVLGKDFKVVRPLASGGMGSVYLVEQLSTGRERALKVMHPQYVKNDDSRERFTQEARVGARIRSEHVVDVVTAGVDDATGIPYLAMELLDGEELAQRIRRVGRLPPSEVREIFAQLCHALGEAHRANLVHRDLKPQNIFIARSRRPGEQFTVKILDFGVAKLIQELDGEQADTTKPVGTPRWMAPEQSDQGAPIKPATDVWALGLIAFHALTGKHYWKAANTSLTNLQSLLREMIVEPISPASERARVLGFEGALPPGFDAWFAKCVVREQHLRYPDASAAFAALDPILAKAPTVLGSLAPEALDDVTRPEPDTLQDAMPARAKADITAPELTPSHGTQPMRGPSHAPLYVAIGVGVVALVIAAMALRQGKKLAQPQPAPAVAQLPEQFTVVFDSFPSGAKVFEGDTQLGTTPMQLSVKNAGLDKEPRKFRIERDGFLPYSVVQGPARDSVRVLATLEPAPQAVHPPPPEPEPVKPPEPEEKPKPHKAPSEDEPELRTRR